MPNDSNTTQPFIHLHTHSAYSLAEGAMHVKDLVKLCVKNKMPAVAVTDSMNMFGAMEFCLAAADAGVQPILGCQISLSYEGFEICLLVQNEIGYQNLSRLISDAYMLTEPPATPFVAWENLERYNAGLICLSGGLKGPLSRALGTNQPKDARKYAVHLQKLFGDRFYIELQRHGLADENLVESGLLAIAYELNIPICATNDVYFSDAGRHAAHDALLCIAEGRYVSEDNRRKVTPDHGFKSTADMVDLFADLPEAVANTANIAKRCAYFLEVRKPILPPYNLGDGRDEVALLRDETSAGLAWRLGSYVENGAAAAVQKIYYDRLEYELGIINQTGFAGYFLIVSDFIRWAKEQKIPVGPGRGSGAGSVVAWALRITDLDPIRFNLLFERFLNPDRISMPDFDIDFCQDRRDEVIAYVQKRYGVDKVAQIITFGKLQARAVVRDVGRVLQMPYGQVDKIAKRIPSNPANPVTLQDALDADADLRRDVKSDPQLANLMDTALKLEGLYRHASTHAAGIVIGDRPLAEIVPLYRDPKSTMPVTQTNMKYIEQQGLIKFDFLGLKTMTVIQNTLDRVAARTGAVIDILQVPLDDKATFDVLARGETVGVFQLESAGMRDLGQKMRISNFEQISALVALYRPGPMENIPQYLKCLHGEMEQDFMHPKLEPVLRDTYGVMIYQEQVMQAAQVLAGYTLGQADLLRRAMGKKIQAEMDTQRARFVEGAKTHSDIEPDRANQIFDTIDKFAGYGFNKAHSAGYALISYWTAWLKANHPLDFMAASMTLDQSDTDKLAIFRQELLRMDIALLPPCVNASVGVFSVEGNAIRYSLAALKGAGTAAVDALVAARGNNTFTDIFDLAERVDPRSLNKKMLEALVASGACDALGQNRCTLFGQAEMIVRYSQNMHTDASNGQSSLFGASVGGLTANRPPIKAQPEWDHVEKLRMECDAVGFYLSAHPLDPVADVLRAQGFSLLADVKTRAATHGSGAMRVQLAGVLSGRQERISKQGRKFAFLQMSDPTGNYEVMLFEDILQRVRDTLVDGTSLSLTAEAELRDDTLRISARDVQNLDNALALKPARCRIDVAGTLNAAQAQNLKSALQTYGGEGAAQIVLRVPIREKLSAEFLVLGRQKVTQSTLAQLRKLDGVQDAVLEAAG